MTRQEEFACTGEARSGDKTEAGEACLSQHGGSVAPEQTQAGGLGDAASQA